MLILSSFPATLWCVKPGWEVGLFSKDDCPRIAVLNPGGKDPEQEFLDFAGEPNPMLHAPVNYHGFAAATGGAFFDSVKGLLKSPMRQVILLLRSDLKVSLKALNELQANRCMVFIAFKECGLHQISSTLLRSGNAALFSTLAQKANGALAVTEDLVEVYRSAGSKNVAFVPTPYPIEDARWDFSLDPDKREGIFVGTREFDVPSRNHLLAVRMASSLAEEVGTFVTVFNQDGRLGRRILVGANVKISEGRLPYPDYLRKMAEHRLVLQLDGSAVPGQVAGDALLCRLPCVGGNGTTERLVFPGLTSHGRALPQIRELALRLLTDEDFYKIQVAEALALAGRTLSFGHVREVVEQAFILLR